MKKILFLYAGAFAVIFGSLNNQALADQVDEDLKRLSVTQTWEGKNGKTISGVFVKREGDTIHIQTSSGKKIQVNIANLSEANRTWFERAWKARAGEATGEIRPDDGGVATRLPDGAKLRDVRVWRGESGNHFRGQFMSREGDIIELVDQKGKIYKLPLSSLSAADRMWFDEAWKKDQAKKNHIKALVQPGQAIFLKDGVLPGVAPIGFKRVPEDKVTRLNVPPLDQNEYRGAAKENNTLRTGLVPFIEWWHNYKVVKIPSRGDDSAKRIEWIFKSLNKYKLVAERFNPELFQGFCQKELKTTACFQVLDLRVRRQGYSSSKAKEGKLPDDRFSPEFLSKYARGANATILNVNVYANGRKQWTAKVPLVECRSSGKVVFYMYGNVKLMGKLVKKPDPKKPEDKKGTKQPRYEIVIDNIGDSPDWFQGRNYTFFLDDEDGVGLMVFVPNLLGEANDEDDK